MTEMKCEVCGEGTLTTLQRMRTTEYAGQIGNVLLHLSVCDVCGSETADEDQSVLNRRAMNRFKKQVDCVPLGNEIRAMRKAAKLTQAEAGALLGGGPVAFSKYESDDLIPDAAMANLLRLAIADPAIIYQLQRLKAATSVTTVKKMEATIHANPSSTWVRPADAEIDDMDLDASVAVEATNSFAEPDVSPWGPN
jgi:HTH-type transcriptional regulator / antitoxin MqsA